uniref:inositol-polyphosphate 5-phosphatase n=1 Tax=Oryctolagus cuniculus TaxID=9986 RepID=A0A5F9C4X4_RABIT
MGACWTSLLTLRLPETGLGAVTLHQPQRTGRGPAWWPQCSSNFLGACSRGLHSTLQLWGWRWGWSRGFCGQQPGGGLWGAVKQDCAAVGGQASMQPGPLGKPRARPWPLLRLGLVSPQTLCTKATMQTVRAADTNEVVKLIFRESDNDRKVMLQLEKKLFDYVNQEVFRDNNGTALLEFDKELSVFKDRLCELDISFPPSYPYSEDCAQGEQYMNTRCPAWCDRILMSPSARELVLRSESEDKVVTYDHIGPSVCMGDHKAGEASAAPGSRASARCSRLRHATCPPAAPHFASASGPFRKSLTYLTVVSVPVTLGRNTGFPSRPRSCCQN